ncbi:cryptochrome/photolyase family protein [Bradymonas sediminis]|uniref:cryptochrome/photolyase family protein n=1 Tax=Bradymonas sediminis TaxID=1548548 RepID=UPI0023B7EE0A|nr:deoxyribodipyrimidine photo-lyase [Bradymonas sediminis]
MHWFRQDLRLEDNPSLVAAARAGRVLPVYILDDENAGNFRMGGASRWWLRRSLSALNASLGGTLNFYRGDAGEILDELCQRFGVQEVHWTRCYEPWRIARDTAIKKALTAAGISARSHAGALLFEPWSISKNSGGYYQIFSPFYKKLRAQDAPDEPVSKPALDGLLVEDPQALALDALELAPRVAWDTGLCARWEPGEASALDRLAAMVDAQFEDYAEGRDFPARDSVSRLSPHLHFGEVSPRQIWQATEPLEADPQVEAFRRQLCWREFSYSLLFHVPELPTENFRKSFDAFAWKNDPTQLARWQQGRTGFPLVDAGMRELWETGTMHNRVRMIAASFLVKNLQIDWRLGAAWFWDCLVDADLANNSASWQWVAGSGTDAAPYFRIFNPTSQAKKYDPDGRYIRRFIPELKSLPNKYLFNPCSAPESVLEAANVRLGKTYPRPMVDLKQSRQQALDAYQLTR